MPIRSLVLSDGLTVSPCRFWREAFEPVNEGMLFSPFPQMQTFGPTSGRFCKVWFRRCEQEGCAMSFCAKRLTETRCRAHAPKPAVVVAYTQTGKRVAPVSREEANKLIGYDCAEWRGRKEGIAITLRVSGKVMLGIVGMWRMEKLCDPRCLDSKTTTKLPGLRGYQHINERTEAYAGGVNRIVRVSERAA